MAAIKGGFENHTSTLSCPIRPGEPFLPIAIVNFLKNSSKNVAGYPLRRIFPFLDRQIIIIKKCEYYSGNKGKPTGQALNCNFYFVALRWCNSFQLGSKS